MSEEGDNNNETKRVITQKRVIKSFEQRIEDLQSYKEKHGHTNVKEKEYRSLYLFCSNYRHARNNPGKDRVAVRIDEERIASLDAMGFVWNMKELVAKKSFFEERVEDLRAYKEKHGHTNVM